ncbi:unnamed protein product, partial [Amoebophrya sp. A25]|eukprot:GSA25T00027691001.1
METVNGLKTRRLRISGPSSSVRRSVSSPGCGSLNKSRHVLRRPMHGGWFRIELTRGPSALSSPGETLLRSLNYSMQEVSCASTYRSATCEVLRIPLGVTKSDDDP